MLDSTAFSVLDVQQFPLVTVRNDAIRPGYASQWAEEMEALIAHGTPFTVLHVETPDKEPHEDFKQRGQWLKQNKVALARVCMMLISVESDPQRRDAAKACGRGATKAFGIPHYAVATSAQAHELVSSLTTPLA